MLRGSVVLYGTGGHLSHILAGVPGRFQQHGADLDLVEFGGVLRRVCRADYGPARLWVRRGREPWRGPFPHWRATRAALVALYGDRGEIAKGLEPGRARPCGAEIVSGGWRYRLAWGGDAPPVRDG